jgi:alpha-aminoadipate carrier protein LysW
VAITFCPECDFNLNLKKPKLGQRVVCQNCRAQLRIVNLRPIELDWSEEEQIEEEEEEDWGSGRKKRNDRQQARRQSARYLEEEDF